MKTRSKITHTQLLKRSQDVTNEIWSVTLLRDYPTPGAKKRAIEHVIRGELEALIGMKSTVDGSESGYSGLGSRCDTILPNPNEDKAALRALVLALHKCSSICAGSTLNKQFLTDALRDAKRALSHPGVKAATQLLRQEGLLP